MTDNVVQFPNQVIDDWNFLESLIRGELEEKQTPEAIVNTVIDRMRVAYREHHFDFEFDMEVEPEHVLATRSAVQEVHDAFQIHIMGLLGARMELELELAHIQARLDR